MKNLCVISTLGIPLPPAVGNGMVRPCQGRTGENMGGRSSFGLAAVCPPPIFSPFAPADGAHHSAANAVSGRNLQRLVAAASKIQLQNEFIKPEIPIS